MDIVEKMAADIALAIDGGDWQDAKWFSKFHRDAWTKAVKPYADEIERLREALTWIERHPVEESKQWEVAVKEMKRLARSALQQKGE